METKLILNSERLSSLCLPNGEIKGVCHHTLAKTKYFLEKEENTNLSIYL